MLAPASEGPVWVASSPVLVLVTQYKRELATDTASSSRLSPALLPGQELRRRERDRAGPGNLSLRRVRLHETPHGRQRIFAAVSCNFSS